MSPIMITGSGLPAPTGSPALPVFASSSTRHDWWYWYAAYMDDGRPPGRLHRGAGHRGRRPPREVGEDSRYATAAAAGRPATAPRPLTPPDRADQPTLPAHHPEGPQLPTSNHSSHLSRHSGRTTAASRVTSPWSPGVMNGPQSYQLPWSRKSSWKNDERSAAVRDRSSSRSAGRSCSATASSGRGSTMFSVCSVFSRKFRSTRRAVRPRRSRLASPRAGSGSR